MYCFSRLSEQLLFAATQAFAFCDYLQAGPATMVGKEAGKAKPLKAPKKGPKEYDEEDLAHLAKKKEEEKALKALKEKAKAGSVGGAGLKKSGKK